MSDLFDRSSRSSFAIDFYRAPFKMLFLWAGNSPGFSASFSALFAIGIVTSPCSFPSLIDPELWASGFLRLFLALMLALLFRFLSDFFFRGVRGVCATTSAGGSQSGSAPLRQLRGGASTGAGAPRTSFDPASISGLLSPSLFISLLASSRVSLLSPSV